MTLKAPAVHGLDEEPPIYWSLAPLNVNVPPEPTVPPLFFQLPATFIFVAWPVRVAPLAIVKLLNDVSLKPKTELVPLKVTVPEL